MLNVDWRSEETTGRGLHLEIQHSTFSNLRFNSRGGDHGAKLHNLCRLRWAGGFRASHLRE